MTCRSPHPRLQNDRLAIHDEPTVSVMMDGLGFLLRRIGPCLEHFQDKQIVFAHETSIGHFAFKIGETFGYQWRHHAFGCYRSQPKALELLDVAARAVA